MFSGRSEKQDGCLDLWLAEIFLTSLQKPLNRIQTNLTGSKDSTSSTNFVFFGPTEKKNKMAARPLIGWDIFKFSSETTEWNLRKLDRKQDPNVLFQDCIFGPISKQKWLSWWIRQKGGTWYSGARYVALWASCLLFSFYFTHKHDICECNGAKHHHEIPFNKVIINYYKLLFIYSSKFFLLYLS